MKRSVISIVTIVLLIVFTSTSMALSSVPVKSIKLNSSNVTIQVGKTYALKVTLTPANTTQKQLIYSTANKNIATVDKSGTIKGIKLGKTVITVTSASNKKAVAKCNVTVSQSSAQSLPPYQVVWMCGTWNANQKGTADVEAAASKYIKSKINATFKMLLIDWGSYQQKRDLMLATNEKVDLCFTASWCGYVQGLAKGEYMNIKDLVDKYCPKSKALVANTPLWLGPQTKNGIYGIPVNKEAGQDWGFMYRKDVTDKHGLDMKAMVPQNSNPLTMLDEYEKVLYQIHKLEPALTAAQSADLTPFYQDGKFDKLGGEVDYLGVKDVGGKLTAIDTLEQPETMQAWQRTHKWYKDGLVQTDVLVDQEHNNTAQQQGTVFSAIFNLKPYKDAETNAGAAKGIVWQQIDMTQPRANTDVVTGTIWAVPSNCPNPARALMCLDLINTDKYLNNLLNFGIEGTNYVKTGENRIDFPAGVTAQTDTYFPNDMPFMANQFINYLWPAEKDDKWQKYQAFNNSCVPTKILGFSFDPTPVKTQIAAFDNIRKQYNDQLSYGVADPTVIGPQYINKMKQAGMAAVLAELQKQLDAWVASK